MLSSREPALYMTKAIVLSIILLLTHIFSAEATTPTVAINEVMASNGSTIYDEDGDAEDWIELYNFGDEPVDLQWFGLSDDYEDPYRWIFPDITINPGEFLLVWASNKDRTDQDQPLHTNFAIASAGEEVLLTSVDGERLDELEPVNLPTDISIGRKPDGVGDWYFFDIPTPVMTNTTKGYQQLLSEPEFSKPAGYHTGPIELELFHPDDHVTIHYTTDGSKPDADSDIWEGPKTLYDRTSEPNDISMIRTTNSDTRSEGWNEPAGSVPKAHTIRAVATRDGYLPSAVNTHSFFIDENGSVSHELPVFSLVTDPDHLFDHETGIYVPGADGESGENYAGNFQNRGREWERKTSLEFFETDGNRVLATDMGLRIHGGWSRRNAQKSVRIYARNEYGDNRFYYSFFQDLPYNQFNRLILRNSGNDWAYSLFRDALAQKLVSHLDFDTQAYRPSVVYINGEYWGIHNIRERYDRHYMNRVYGLHEDELDLLTGRYYADEGDNEHWLGLLDYADTHDLSDESHFEHMTTLMDMENYLNYYVSKIFYAENDWPHNNIDYFRKRVPYDSTAAPGHDGRWRWMMRDLDRSFNLSTQDDFDMIEWVTLKEDGRYGEEWPNLLFRNLLENDYFRISFINRIADHLNTTFHQDRLKAAIDKQKAIIGTEIENQILRWQKQGSKEEWLEHSAGVNAMYRFVDNREDHLREHVRAHFEIDSDIVLQLDVSDPSGGYITIHTSDINSNTPGVENNPWPWTGAYFQEIPVTIQANPWPGFSFSHWEIADSVESGKHITLPMHSDTSVKAVFHEDDSELFPEPVVLAETDFEFHYWPADTISGSFPEHMAFVYMDEPDPNEYAGVSGYTDGYYNLENRTRINGLGDEGFAFINTSNPDGNPGYPGTRLGGALLALDTRDSRNIAVTFEAGTVRPNSRVYNFRLQYRLGDDGEFRDLTNKDGDPAEYLRHEQAGHTDTIGPLILPAELEDKAYIQLLWRYYYTGTHLDPDNGQRSKLNISEIRVTSETKTSSTVESIEKPEAFGLKQNYPNPFNSHTIIPFDLPEAANVTLEIFDVTGRLVAELAHGSYQAGSHSVTFDAGNLSSGVYIYRLQTHLGSKFRKMIILK